MMNKIKLMLATSVLVVGGVAGFAAAEGDHRDHPDDKAMIEKFDTNKDGKLDDTERAAMKQARIAKFDTNHDGKLDDAERAAMQELRAAEEFKKLDTNGDGKLTLDEFKAGRSARGGGMHRHHRGGGHNKP